MSEGSKVIKIGVLLRKEYVKKVEEGREVFKDRDV